VDDPENQYRPVLLDHVVHDPVLADPEAMERIGKALDRLHGLSPDPTGFRDIGGELLERPADPGSDLRWELLERPSGGGGKLDLVRLQSSSLRLAVRPFA
jgi:hypothetical protein